MGAVIKKATANKATIDLSKIETDNVTISCAIFDGTKVWEDRKVVLKDGVITKITPSEEGRGKSEYFLMPGLIDGHLHLAKPEDMETLLKNGVTTACDVSASEELEKSFTALNVWSSRTIAWLGVDDAKSFVDGAIASGGKYIKVVADVPPMMGGRTISKRELEDIVDYAHKKNMKVAVHAISVAAVRMAVDAGVDILIHIPIGEEFPKDLAKRIAEQNIAVMPTLIMMKAFADSPSNSYKKSDYEYARKAVALLHSNGVPILAGTDSSDSSFVPNVKYGSSLHKEVELLVEAGLSPIEALQGATIKTAYAFGIDNIGKLETGGVATMVLVKGRPDKNITDSIDIVQIWIAGKPVLPKKNGIGDVITNSEELVYFSKHPSTAKTFQIETTDMPLMEQEAPFEVRTLYEKFIENSEGALKTYEDKRFEVTGVAIKIGLDIHQKPSIEISDKVTGKCYALCIFPTDDFYSRVHVGDRVTVRANYLVTSNLFGVVMKHSELIRVEKQ
jgi:imidazolonepropionase-like amidohydrolase